MQKTRPATALVIVSAVVYQLGWFVCVLFGDVPSLFFLIFFAVLMYFFFKPSKKTWTNAIRVTAVGCAMDAILVHMGFYAVPALAPTLPIWLACIWALFALALPYGFSFLSGRYVLASVLGSIGGPIAYYSGARLSPELSFALPLTEALIILALLWAAIMPYIVWLTDGNEKYAAQMVPQEVLK